MTRQQARVSSRSVCEEDAWRFLLSLSRSVRLAAPVKDGTLIGYDRGMVHFGVPGRSFTFEIHDGGRAWRTTSIVEPGAERLLELYLALCLVPTRRPYVIAHLGQSLDGRIATESGVSQYVTGIENITHMHRLRALCDAIIVGAGTVHQDDPQLTTRAVDGPNPVRVIIDPARRLPDSSRVFVDPSAPTILITGSGDALPDGYSSNVQVVAIDRNAEDGRISESGIIASLQRRGLTRIFIEGGGVTISRFLDAGLIDRLQLTVAPVILGSGRSGVSLPPILTLDEALRPRVKHHAMGDDILFDCEFDHS